MYNISDDAHDDAFPLDITVELATQDDSSLTDSTHLLVEVTVGGQPGRFDLRTRDSTQRGWNTDAVLVL
jgi:hypothetical protein